MVKRNNKEGLLQNQMISGLSLTDRILYASWMSEHEIGDRELEKLHDTVKTQLDFYRQKDITDHIL